MSKLHDRYTTSAVMKLLSFRYGLNPVGLRELLQCDGKRLQHLILGHMEFNMDESVRIVSAFNELTGKFVYAQSIVKDVR